MTVYVLDSSALIRYIDNEAGAIRVEEILKACTTGRAKVWISAVQWGEVAANLRARLGESGQMNVLSSLLPSEAEILPATAGRAVLAAALRVDRKISYADAFALDLAMDSTQHVLVTADYGFKSVDSLAKIEFLPPK